MITQHIKKAVINSLKLLGTNDNDSFVLCYHDVDKGCKLTPDIFEYQLQYYKKHGYSFVSGVEGLESEKRILLTFDDGYTSFYENVLPILEKYSVPCILFVPTSFLGGKLADGISDPVNQSKTIMSLGMLEQVSGSGLVELGCHTHSHLDMTGTDLEGIREDINKSLSVIEPLAGGSCSCFCYPQGKVNDEVKELVREMGFEYAFTTKERTFSRCDDLFEIPRYAGDYFINEMFLGLSRNSNCNLYMKVFSG